MAERMEREYEKLVEAMLFAAGRALAPEEIAKHMGIASIGSVIKIADRLVEDYKTRDSAVAVVRMGTKYSMTLREQYAGKVSALASQPDISRGGLRILAYVSKNEPLMQSAIVRAFGGSTYEYIKELVEKEFITSRSCGRTKKIETAPKFNEYFNLQK